MEMELEYNRLVEKYQYEWQCETGERLKKLVNGETEYEAEVEDY